MTGGSATVKAGHAKGTASFHVPVMRAIIRGGFTMMRVGMAEGLIVLGILKILFLILVVIVGTAVILLTRGNRVRCTYCGERIRKEATLCRYCGREVKPAAPGSASSPGGTDSTG
jgi:hypothetical protein